MTDPTPATATPTRPAPPLSAGDYPAQAQAGATGPVNPSKPVDQSKEPKDADSAVKPPLTTEQLAKRRKDAFVLAQAQAKERADLAKKQAEARKPEHPLGHGDVATADAALRAKLTLDQKEERRVLAEKHGEARLKIDPTGRVVFSGLDMAGKVSELAADLAGSSADLDFVVAEPTEFGLDLEVFDPMSGIVITAAQGARRNIGQPAILLTADQVVAEVVAARTHQQSALQ